VRAAWILAYAALSERCRICVQYVNNDEHPAPRYNRRPSTSASAAINSAVAARSVPASTTTRDRRSASDKVVKRDSVVMYLCNIVVFDRSMKDDDERSSG